MTDKLDPTLAAALAATIAPVQPDTEARAQMRQKLFSRVHEGKTDFLFVHTHEGYWQNLLQGVDVKLLRRDADSRSFMLRMDANTRVPPHEHPSDEECIVLEGEVWLNGILCKAGDYHLAPKGQPHDWLRSDTGCLLFIRGASESHQAHN